MVHLIQVPTGLDLFQVVACIRHKLIITWNDLMDIENDYFISATAVPTRFYNLDNCGSGREGGKNG